MSQELYRVRDRNYETIWGEDLTLEEAQKLKESVVGQRKSHTARVEPMSVPVPGHAVEMADLGDLELAPPVAAAPPPPARRATPAVTIPDRVGPDYSLDVGEVEVAVASPGVVVAVPDGHELVVNGQARAYPTQVQAGDRVIARAVDPQIIAARAKALAAARAAAPATKAAPKRYRDVTVKAPVPRTAPAPRDRTVKAGVHVRLGPAPVSAPAPLPSPLKVAVVPEGRPVKDGEITDAELHDLTPDLGGGASDADLEYAAQQRDQQ